MGAGPGPLEVPLSEVIGALSYALDLTEGEPPGHAVRTCMIGMRLAQELGLGAATRRPLLRAAAQGRGLLGELRPDGGAVRRPTTTRAKRSSKRVDWARSYPAFLWSLRTVAPGGSLRSRAEQLMAISARRPSDALADAGALRARRGDRSADRARPGHGRRRSAGSTSTGTGTASPRASAARRSRSRRGSCASRRRSRSSTRRAARRGAGVAKRRSGGWFDPRSSPRWRARRRHGVLGARCRRRPRAVGAEERRLTADEELPGPDRRRVRGRGRRQVPLDLPPLRPRFVIAMSIARARLRGPRALSDLRRAALLHDIGKLAISNRILDKPARLTDGSSRWCAQHPLYHELILERTPQLPRARAAGGRAPRAARRQRLSARPDGGELTRADADPRGGRRLRGADLPAALPAGEELGRRARGHPARGPAPARPRRVSGWRPCSGSAAPTHRPPRPRSTTRSAPRPCWGAATPSRPSGGQTPAAPK